MKPVPEARCEGDASVSKTSIEAECFTVGEGAGSLPPSRVSPLNGDETVWPRHQKSAILLESLGREYEESAAKQNRSYFILTDHEGSHEKQR